MRLLAFPYPLILLALWTGVLALGDYVVAETSAHQALSARFTATTCEIMRSELEQGPVGRRGVGFHYKYSVNGMDYIGRRYRYDERNVAFDYRAVANAFASGTMQPVFYNPANPADSLLSPGLAGSDLLIALFGVPLNIVTVAVWIALLRVRRGPHPLPPAGGVRILRQPSQTRARLAASSPSTAGFFGLAAAASAAAMMIVFTAGFAPSMRLMTTTLLCVAVAGAVVFLWTAQRHHRGRWDLCIDDAAQSLVLPPAAGRNEPLTIPRSNMVAVSMCRRVSYSPSGQTFSYLPALDAALNGQPQRLLLVNWGWTEGKASAFSGWLSQHLGIPFNGIKEE